MLRYRYIYLFIRDTSPWRWWEERNSKPGRDTELEKNKSWQVDTMKSLRAICLQASSLQSKATMSLFLISARFYRSISAAFVGNECSTREMNNLLCRKSITKSHLLSTLSIDGLVQCKMSYLFLSSSPYPWIFHRNRVYPNWYVISVIDWPLVDYRLIWTDVEEKRSLVLSQRCERGKEDEESRRENTDETYK